MVKAWQDIIEPDRGIMCRGKPMSFGVAHFNDAESAWKAATCNLPWSS